MQNKLQELTEKIYKEGISKGNAEADSIISEAKNEAKSIVENAKKDAEKIIKDAEKKSSEYRTNAESELKLSSKQALTSIKQQITDLINGSIVKDAVDKAYDDDKFIQEVIKTAINNWTTDSEQTDFNVLVPAAKEKEFVQFFQKSAKNLLDKGLEVKSSSGIKTGFQLIAKDGGYKISFTEADFVNFLKQYLRPKMVELLFED